MSNFQTLDRLLQSFVDNGLPGCTLHVTQHGETIYEGFFGMANRETGEKITDRSIFRMASMSKLPLYTTMMILYERGEFLLSDPISRFLPEWESSRKYVRLPNGYVTTVPTSRPINISDTLSMKCGLPYCNSYGPTDNLTLRAMQRAMQPLVAKGHFTNREQVAAISTVPLACEPGERWIYGFSSELAAAIIEAVCGKGIDDVFQELLFDPLEMPSTRSRFFGDTQQRMVQLYRRESDRTLTPVNLPIDEKHLPGEEHEEGWARLFSTGSDYSHLMTMLACGGVYKGRRILGRKTIDMMRANGLPNGLEGSYFAGYGYGYGVRTLMTHAEGSNGSLGAFGWSGGFGTWCESDPSEELAVVYMHNMVPCEEEYYHLRVRSAVYGCLE